DSVPISSFATRRPSDLSRSRPATREYDPAGGDHYQLALAGGGCKTPFLRRAPGKTATRCRSLAAGAAARRQCSRQTATTPPHARDRKSTRLNSSHVKTP